MKQFLLSLWLVAAGLYLHAQPDCKDHPLFTPMQHFALSDCQYQNYHEMGFYTLANGTVNKGGKYTYLVYTIPSGTGVANPSSLEIIKNFVNATKRAGGQVLYETSQDATLKFVKNGAEAWVAVAAVSYGEYRLKIVELEAMKQSVAANADAMRAGLNENGHIALYGILFDTGSAVLKPESGPTLAEVGKLLNATKTLTVFVVGHTDNQGDYQANLKLSADRAASVIRALTTQHGVAVNQLIPFGAGPTSPVASNDTDRGRTLNRRVELVAK